MRITDSKHPYFSEYKTMGAPLVLGLIIITLGLYMIPWIYTKNKEFHLVDKETPNANRGVILLLIMPFAWGYLLYVFRALVWDHPFVQAVQFFGWLFVIFLLLKYIWDFCHSFARITENNGFIWFLFFFFPFFAIPAMQSELNTHFHSNHMRRKYHQLYK